MLEERTERLELRVAKVVRVAVLPRGGIGQRLAHEKDAFAGRSGARRIGAHLYLRCDFLKVAVASEPHRVPGELGFGDSLCVLVSHPNLGRQAQVAGGPECELEIGELGYLGQPLPTREISFAPRLQLFDWLQLSALVDHKGGFEVFNNTARFRCNFGNCQEAHDPSASLEDQAANIAHLMNSDAGYVTDVHADASALRAALDSLDEPAVIVGHSYGGVVITEAGNDPKVAGLVYVAAFAPDAGESVAALIKDPPPGAAAPPILPPQDGFLFLDKAKFAQAFAADVDPGAASFMADSQVPWSVDSLTGAVSQPAWKAKPSTYIVATEDRMIPPPAQRAMAARAGARVVDVKGSHALYVSQPAAIAWAIQQAAEAL